MASSSSIFSGNSRFANDFGSVIDRSVAIASLPLTLIRQQKTKLDDQATALSSLGAVTSSLQSTLNKMQDAFGSSAFSTVVGDSLAVTATTSESAQTGSWSLSVDNLGSTTAFVVSGFPPVSDPAASGYLTGSSQTLLLDLDPNDGLNNPEVITLQPAGTSLSAVVAEINKTAGSKVQASIVNIGSTTSPQYQLSLQSKKLGPVDIKFNDDARESANTAGQRGSLATYTVNGTPIQTDARTVTLSPGITLELKKTTSGMFNVSVERSSGSLATALGEFVKAFNSVIDEIDKHRGNRESVLAGDSLLASASASLRSLVSTSSPSGGFNSLADLGIGFQKDGKLSLDSEAFTNNTKDKLDQVQTFLGKTGESGLLKRLDDILNSLNQSGTGLISSAIDTTRAASTKEQQHIDSEQDRIDRLKESLLAQMAAADAMIAMLEQQVSYMTGMFAAMKTASESNK